MVQIDGTYELQSQENYREYLISLGFNEEQITKQSEITGKVVISPVEEDQVTVAYGGRTVTFPLNKEFEQYVSPVHKHWTTTTLNNDGLTFKTKHTEDGSLGEDKVFKISDNGLIVTSTNTKGVKAIRHYKRV